MNQESIRNYCLSLPEVEERMPFGAFKAAKNLLAFFVHDKMFCYFDIEKFNYITVKSECADELKANFTAVGNPYIMSAKSHKKWIGVMPDGDVSDEKMKSLILASYELVAKGK